MQRILRENGLSLALTMIFVLLLVGQSVAGRLHYNEEQQDHGQQPVSYGEYLTTGSFLEATMENWESEFLQMAIFVIFTIFLYQKGSAESKSIDEPEDVDREPNPNAPDAPWPVRRGGWILKLYENSLSLALFLLFALSFWLHAVGGARDYSQEQLAHGGQAVTTLGYFATSQFWFESLQNWQSEFLSIAVMVVFTIFLRQKGSAESKPVDSPNSQTGRG
jgi:hypothetical protein